MYEWWLEFLDDHPQVKEDWISFVERKSGEDDE